MAKKRYSVYKHTNRINGKVYIGITRQEPEKRWGEGGCNYSGNKHFSDSINKYGWDSFRHEILEEGITEAKAIRDEKKLIKEYQSYKPEYGYNNSMGGEVYHPSKKRLTKKKK